MRWLCALWLAAAVGCGDDAGSPVDAAHEPDAEAGDGDAGVTDAFVPDARSDCRVGEHRCVEACVEDLPDEPATCTTLGAACGMLDDGCGGAVSCGACGAGATCMAGACACAPDASEPNDDRSESTGLGTLTDSPDSSRTVTGHALGSSDDEDWFHVDVEDGTDFGNPQVTVTLSAIPSGSDYDLEIFYLCSGNASVCTAGTPVTLMDGCASRSRGSGDETAGLSAECSGIDDSGLLLVRVVSTTWSGSCEPYDLLVDVQ